MAHVRPNDARLRRMRDWSLMKPIARPTTDAAPDAALDMGWGRLVFAQTFSSPAELAAAMGEEGPDRRDIAVYVRDPHVVLAQSPQELFLDPSETYRLDLAIYRPSRRQARGFFIRRLCSRADAEAVNDIYVARGMVPVPPDFFWSQRDSRIITVYVAEDEVTGEILGSVTGVDHARAFGDPEKGSSLWCLAVAPQAAQPRIGEMLVRRLANFMKARGSAHLDLSVLHDNGSAITLYEKLGFTRVPYFAIKRKNPINEQLFIGPEPDPDFNPYARLIIDEARRRGIHTEAIDAPGGFFVLSHGGRSVRCRESLSEFTSAVAMSICDDKAATRRVVEAAGVSVPAQIAADDRPAVESFLARHGRVVVKPARGEQGRGVFIDLHDIEDVHAAIDAAGQISTPVIVEEFVEGEDLRLVVIDYRVVAAAVRRPAQIVGDGVSSARQLIDVQSRRRSVATGGESKIPFDAETERCLADCNLTLTDTPEKGQIVPVRKTANLHTGGTIHDVTDEAHPVLIQAAIDAARAIVIPVTGIDLMVKSPREPVYRFIEANERPGLANHEPRPTAERFLDLLFPMSAAKAVRGARAKGAA